MHNCHANAKCTNTVGSFQCDCNPGYDGDGVKECNPDPEQLCKMKCDANANCEHVRDTIVNCECKPGYDGDGTKNNCAGNIYILVKPKLYPYI